MLRSGSLWRKVRSGSSTSRVLSKRAWERTRAPAPGAAPDQARASEGGRSSVPQLSAGRESSYTGQRRRTPCTNPQVKATSARVRTRRRLRPELTEGASSQVELPCIKARWLTAAFSARRSGGHDARSAAPAAHPADHESHCWTGRSDLTVKIAVLLGDDHRPPWWARRPRRPLRAISPRHGHRPMTGWCASG